MTTTIERLPLGLLIAASMGWLIASTAAPAQALQVTAHAPSAYALGVPTRTAIVVTFDGPLDPLTVTAATVRVEGMVSGIHASSLAVAGESLTIDLAVPLAAGELVTVGLSSAILGANGLALTDGYAFQFTSRVEGAGLALAELDRWSTSPAVTPYFLYGGDLDRDGRPDAAAPNEGTHDVSVFLNDGGPGFASHLEYGVGSVPSSCFGADLNNDGWTDLATADINSGTVSLLLNSGAAEFVSGQSYAGGAVCRQVHGGDLDGDGDIDLVTTGFNSQSVTVHTNAGDGTFTQTVWGAAEGVTAGPFAVWVGDFTLDGRLDVAVASQSVPRQLRLFLNAGGGSFVQGATVPVANGAWDLFGNDLDGDGDLDLVLAEASAGKLHVFAGDGAGGFTDDWSFTAGSFPLAVFAADMDGDDDCDLVASNFSSRDIRVFENQGGQTFVLAEDLDLVQSGSYAWAHDLDGDGDLDLTAIDELADLIFVFLNNSAAAAGPVDAPPQSVVFGLPFPNPARSGVAFDVRGASVRAPRIVIYDVQGRTVRHLSAPSGASVRVHWDLRTDAGQWVPGGRYFATMAGVTGAPRSLLVVR